MKIKNNYKICRITDETEWEALFSRVKYQQMPQTWAFGEAKAHAKWQAHRIVIKQSNQPVAICQVLTKNVMGIPIVSRINQGPMMLATHAEKELEVLGAVREHWRYLRHGILFIQPAKNYSTDTIKILKGIGFKLRNNYRWKSARLDLTRSEEDLRKSLKSAWNRQLKKAERNELQFTEVGSAEDLEWFLENHIEDMSQKGYAGPTPELVRGMYQAKPTNFHLFKVLHDNIAVASLMAYRVSDSLAQNYILWNNSKGRKLAAGNFCYWHAAMALKRLGYTKFDLGGYNTTTGFGAFKLGMNGAEYELAGEFVTF